MLHYIKYIISGLLNFSLFLPLPFSPRKFVPSVSLICSRGTWCTILWCIFLGRISHERAS